MSQSAQKQKTPLEEASPAPRRRRRERHSGGDHGGASMAHDESNWLVSYADMMTLLFGFFVLMYTFSRIDTKKFEIVRKDVARYFGGQVKVTPTLKRIEDEAKDVISNAGLDKSVELVAKDSQIELRFNGRINFVAGTAKMTDEAQHALGKLIDIVKTNVQADSVVVEGHTDDNPIQSVAFPSNWELSSARASTVVREFEKFGFDPSKLTAEGYGSSRPVAPNRDSKGEPIGDNQESNRRVIVTIGFSKEMQAAVSAMKTNLFVPHDEVKKGEKEDSPLVRAGEGEMTWKEKMDQEMNSVNEKLRVAEERLKETEEKAIAAKRLADMKSKLDQVQNRIGEKQKQVDQYNRVPASNKKK
jgi:chemotaxis protein MotB